MNIAKKLKIPNTELLKKTNKIIYIKTLYKTHNTNYGIY